MRPWIKYYWVSTTRSAQPLFRYGIAVLKGDSLALHRGHYRSKHCLVCKLLKATLTLDIERQLGWFTHSVCTVEIRNFLIVYIRSFTTDLSKFRSSWAFLMLKRNFMICLNGVFRSFRASFNRYSSEDIKVSDFSQILGIWFYGYQINSDVIHFDVCFWVANWRIHWFQ